MIDFVTKIWFYVIPILTFAFGMFITLKFKVKKPLNFKQMVDIQLFGREEADIYYSADFGIRTNELSEKVGRNLGEIPYNVYYVDQYGEKHLVTLAQIEDSAIGANLVLYSMISGRYDNKGRYKR